jgi:NADH:ubiquinone oxidoreductase subunit F (NADH-binding)
LASAGFIVIDNSISILAVTQAVARFLFVESCTQCFACKDGLRRASEALDRLWQGNSEEKDSLLAIKTSAESAPQGNRCYLPVQGSLLIPSLLKNFPKEFAVKRSGTGKGWLIPKMSDYDTKRKQFILDEAQALKQPDWSFLPKS